MTAEDCWQVVREASRDFGFAHVRMQLAGEHYEERLDDTIPGKSCTMRIPLSDSGHVNLTHHSDPSVRNMVAMISLVHVLQRVLGSRVQQFSGMDHLQRSNSHDAKSLVASH